MAEKPIEQKLREYAEGSSDDVFVFCREIAGIDYAENYGMRKTALYIAEQIEIEQREIIEAQHSSAHHIMKVYAKEKGMPMDDGEHVTQWLDRWFHKKPLSPDGKPWNIGDEAHIGDANYAVKDFTVKGFRIYDGAETGLLSDFNTSYSASMCIRPADSPKKLLDDMVAIISPTQYAHEEFISRLAAFVERNDL